MIRTKLTTILINKLNKYYDPNSGHSNVSENSIMMKNFFHIDENLFPYIMKKVFHNIWKNFSNLKNCTENTIL